ncbi:unnamed protein product [Gemmata massiliana]|uniref:Uncharacterized protein n=1 Tax=Gemmata massiliana TaxID=1210884 RepID=A0A6P2D1R8_9BACT|nr:unnamed protein product [Gemmata massiliana]
MLRWPAVTFANVLGGGIGPVAPNAGITRGSQQFALCLIAELGNNG